MLFTLLAGGYDITIIASAHIYLLLSPATIYRLKYPCSEKVSSMHAKYIQIRSSGITKFAYVNARTITIRYTVAR
jgi:hypothetical protein